MVLYIEYVLIDNIVVDWLLLKLLKFTFKENFSRKNMFLSCIIGTISALFLPFLVKFTGLIVVYKILTALLMILVLKKYKTYKKYFLYLLIFFLYTMLFGGIGIAILNVFNIPYTINGLILYNCEFPISILIIIFWLGSWLMKKVVRTLNDQMKLNNHTYSIKLIDRDEKIECVGFYDSGNTIDRDGNAVSIISMNTFLKLYKDYPVEKLLFRNIADGQLKDPRYIQIKAISSSSSYLSFVIDKLIVNDQEINNAVIAVAMQNFKNFDCILNSSILGGK